MSIFEYDEEKEMVKIRKAEREAGVEEGIECGIKQGTILGEEKLSELCRLLLKEGKSEEIVKVIEDKEYRKQCYEKYL